MNYPVLKRSRAYRRTAARDLFLYNNKMCSFAEISRQWIRYQVGNVRGGDTAIIDAVLLRYSFWVRQIYLVLIALLDVL